MVLTACGVARVLSRGHIRQRRECRAVVGVGAHYRNATGDNRNGQRRLELSVARLTLTTYPTQPHLCRFR